VIAQEETLPANSRFLPTLVLAIVAGINAMAPAAAQTPEQYYKGKIMHRGEVDMFSGSWHVWRATQKNGLDDGSLIPVIQGGLTRTADLPNVPLMQELVDDPKTKKIIEFISAGSAIGRALIAPPNVPADRLAALRTAFDQVAKDPDFIADAAKRSADLEPTSGAKVQTYSDAIARAPKDVIEAANPRHCGRKDKLGQVSPIAR
jgi:hypothetical protein